MSQATTKLYGKLEQDNPVYRPPRAPRVGRMSSKTLTPSSRYGWLLLPTIRVSGKRLRNKETIVSMMGLSPIFRKALSSPMRWLLPPERMTPEIELIGLEEGHIMSDNKYYVN
jgi:hypothetical protein